MPNTLLPAFAEKVEYGFWERYNEDHMLIRLATDWATSDEEIDALPYLLDTLNKTQFSQPADEVREQPAR